MQVDVALGEGPSIAYGGGLRNDPTYRSVTPRPNERQFWRYKDDKQQPPSSDISDPNTQTPQQDTDPSTYDGTWVGANSSELHVREIVIAKKQFPCDGNVAIQYGNGQIINMPVIWQAKDAQLVGMFGDGEKKISIATIKLSAEGLSGQITPPTILGGANELTFRGLQKIKNGN